MRKREICTCLDDPQTLVFHVLFVSVENDEAILPGTDTFRSIPTVRCWCSIVSTVLLRLGLVWYLSVLTISLAVVSKVIYTWRQAFVRCTVVRFDFAVSYCSAYSSTIYYFALEFLHELFFSLKETGLKEPCECFSGDSITSRCFLRPWRIDRFDPSIRFEDRIFDQMPSIEKVFATIDVNSFGCRWNKLDDK